jgi:glutaryl-CoA dehydrogenase
MTDAADLSASPDPSDVLDLDVLLTAEELAVRQKIRDFTDQRIRPGIAAWYDAAVFPLELAPELGGLGVRGCTCRAMGAPGGPPSNTAWLRWNWRRAIPGSARSFRFRVPWP